MTTAGTTISVCPPPGPDRERLLAARLHEWLGHDQLHELVRRWGGSPPANASLSELLDYLVPFSDVWDYRGKARGATGSAVSSQDSAGASRWEVTDDARVGENQELVLRAARALGLARVRLPRRRFFDYVLILGGARLSNLFRVRRAKELLDRGALEAKALVLLGSLRDVMESERDATDTYAPSARTELDLLVRAAELELGIDAATASTSGESGPATTDARRRAWSFRAHAHGDVPLLALAAPSREPAKRRATSADSYAFFHDTLAPSPGASCLLITSQIYVPYQHLEAVRTLALPYDIELETIGFPIRWGGRLQGLRAPANYLQEIRSTIQAAGRLAAAMDRTSVPVAASGR
jgi:hypothetical protein